FCCDARLRPAILGIVLALGSSRCGGASSLARRRSRPGGCIGPPDKTDLGKNPTRDWSFFAQYRNNGFAAHRRGRQAAVERAREPGGGGQQKLVRDLSPARPQRQLQLFLVRPVLGDGPGPRWLLPT